MTEIRVIKTPSEEFYSNVLITAFDGSYGACWYWAEPARDVNDNWLTYYVNAREDRWEACRVRVKEDEPTGNALWDVPQVVTHDVLAIGIQRIIDQDTPVSDHLRDYIMRGVLDDDAGEIDSDCADVIVQAGIFGQVVFG